MNLIIGNSSQLSYFFPDNNFYRISSRNINYNLLDKQYDKVYLTFANQRTFDKSLSEKDFLDVNVKYTSSVVDYFSKISNKVIIYGTAELWNNSAGPIDLHTSINYKYSPYVKSKEVLYNTLLENRLKNKWNNVIIIHPFNFNSLYRKKGFLFYKIFDSLINGNKNYIGNININRDIVHVSYLISKSLICEDDTIIGSGKLINVEKFVNDIFLKYNKQYTDFLIQDKSIESYHKNNEYWLKTEFIYNNLFEDTINEIKKYERNKISQ